MSRVFDPRNFLPYEQYGPVRPGSFSKGVGANAAIGSILYMKGMDSDGRPIWALASNASASTANKITGVSLSETTADGQEILVTEWLVHRDVNTAGATEGANIWMGTAGGYVFAAPGGGAVVKIVGMVGDPHLAAGNVVIQPNASY